MSSQQFDRTADNVIVQVIRSTHIIDYAHLFYVLIGLATY